jgi:putative transposase
VAKEIGCCVETLRLWVKAAKAALAGSSTPPSDNGGIPPEDPGSSGEAGADPLDEGGSFSTHDPAAPDSQSPAPEGSPGSTAPKDPGAGLSELEKSEILKLKKRHPSMGLAQIRAQLKRFKRWRLSVRAIRRVLLANGYELEHRGGRPQEPAPPTRWEAPHRNAIWQIDFTDVRIPEGRRALGVVLDDFSRFVVSFGLIQNPTSEDVVALVKEGIRLHGKPDAIYTDRAGPFMAWGKAEGFQRFMEQELIDHIVTRAYHPQGRGKVEAVLKTVQRELWEIQHFHCEEEAVTALSAFFLHYNHRRAHMGIEGLTPADRFFGRWEAVLAAVQAESRNRNGAGSLKANVRLLEELLPAERAEIVRLVAVDGQLELRFFGHRVRLGQIES